VCRIFAGAFLFTLGILAIYRLGAHIGAPGINKEPVGPGLARCSGPLACVLDLFSGGNFRTISVFALGVTPYITASIICSYDCGLATAKEVAGRRRDGPAENQPVDQIS